MSDEKVAARNMGKYIGVNVSGVPPYLVCEICGCMVDPDYVEQHSQRCK